MIGGWELVVILFIVLLLFGGKKLPEFAKNLGRGVAEFKKATSQIQEGIEGTEPPPENIQTHSTPENK
jgi:TatA/E family protein of Tat protein translocase